MRDPKATPREKYRKVGKPLKPCCDMFIPFGFDHCFLGIPLWSTVMCISCRRKARGRTIEKAIDKWNEKLNQTK